MYGCHYQLQKEVIMCFCKVKTLPYQNLFEASHIISYSYYRIKFEFRSCNYVKWLDQIAKKL